jgi:hypothetical protein
MTDLSSQTAQAQNTLVESGTSTLANVFGISTGPEALTVSWFVFENSLNDVYTYQYNVNNPSGDVVLNGPNSPTSTPEIVDSFSLTFDATVAGAIVSATAPVGGSFQNNGANGIAWTFPDVSPGTSSPLLAFQSALGPGPGNASAADAVPPSPWSTVPNGASVPVPRAVPEPEATSLIAMAGLFLLPLRSRLGRFFRQS